MQNELALLEHKLGYKFNSLSLLERAVTHRSWAHEKLPDGSEEDVRNLHNESFEFIGDSVLGLAVAEQLFAKHPNISEGGLTLMKHQLVSAETLARLAEDLGLGEFLRLGKGEEKTGGKKKHALLADMLEAIIGAVFLDSGYVTARSFIARIFLEDMRTATPKKATDFKTLLQETLQARKSAAPNYSVTSTDGPPHARTFHVEARWDTGVVSGSGSTIKQAEMEAASKALEILASEQR